MQTVAIIGLGLIGGSFGLALRKAGFTGEILGLSEPPYSKAAIDRGAIDREASLSQICEQAGLIYLSQAVDGIIQTLQQIGPLANPNCLITDSGSTKRAISNCASRVVERAHFVGGHPMAGKEKRGVQEAEADLFRNRPYVLTTDFAVRSPHAEALEHDFRHWLERIGAVVMTMTTDSHDRTVAYSSHLPQLLSTTLANTLATETNGAVPQVFGSGLLDMSRLAASSGELWASILDSNRDRVVEAIEAFEEQLAALKVSLQTGCSLEAFQKAASFARELRKSLDKS